MIAIKLLNKRSSSSVQEEPPPIESTPNVIVCTESQFNCSCCYKGFNYCPSPPEYDTTNAKNHQGLTGLLDMGRGGGDSDVEKKFSELHEKLRHRHLNPFYWIIPIIVLCLACVFVVAYIESIHQVQCRSSNICSPQNYTLETRGECPKIHNGAKDCCTAFCFRSLENSTNWDDEGCYPDTTLDEHIRSNTPFGQSCGCRPCSSCGRNRVRCGRVKYYGDFMDLPGSYASSHVTGTLKAMCAIVPLIIASVGFLYAWVKTRKVEPIIQDHFMDWKERGVEVDYQSPRVIGRRLKQKGYIVFSLPSTISAQPSSLY